jgi:1-acyl-sn-glycerol-3-phosphate acyltransferase/nucleoside-diphosphate-sugar epimerase
LPTVAVVGSRDSTTERLLRELDACAGLFDGTGPASPRIHWRAIIDRRDEAAPAALTAVEAVVYLAACRGRRGVPDNDDAAAWFERCNEHAVPHVIVVSSTQVFVPDMRHPGLVSEARGELPPCSHPIAARWRELESLAKRLLDERATTLTLLRPTALPVPGGDDFFSRLLHGRNAVTLPGHDPSLQLLSVAELAGAVVAAIRGRREGLFHLAPRRIVSLRHALRERKIRRWPVPRTLQRPLRALLAPLGLADAAAQLDYIRYDWTVSAAKAERSLGFRAGVAKRPAAGTEGVATRADRLPPGDDHFAADDDHFAVGDDPFGMDRDFIDALGRRLLGFLHDRYWRVELDGLEHIPRTGPVVLVGVHRGHFPWDAMMILHVLATRSGRYPRFLVHPGLLKFPFFFNLFRKMGGVLACRENADYVLAGGGVLGVLPEGVEGAFRPYKDAYRLGRFGRGAFVKAAWRHRATIVPFVTVGSAEATPILARITSRRWRRYSLWPYIPITPTLLPLPLPLPSKWHTRFLPPRRLTTDDPEAAAGNHALVQRETRAIRASMQAALDEIRARRPSVFAGNAFDR